MSVQRKLNALLFELQTARSPLAQAKVLARAWRTLRELSPTDRRLLARHVSFDGAEEMLEGLGTRKGGWAPAMLLQILSNARDTEASTAAGPAFTLAFTLFCITLALNVFALGFVRKYREMYD